MKNFNENNASILVGAVAGAVLMALMIMLVFGLRTGIAGAVIVVLTVAVSIFSGWLIGMNQRIQKRNWYCYLKGYREGVAKHTTVIEHPMCRCTLTVDKRIGNNISDIQ